MINQSINQLMSLELSKNTLLFQIEQMMKKDFLQLFEKDTIIQNTGKVDLRNGYYTNQKLRYIQNTYLFLLTVYIGVFIGSVVTMIYNEHYPIIVKMMIIFGLFIFPILSVQILTIFLFSLRQTIKQ